MGIPQSEIPNSARLHDYIEYLTDSTGEREHFDHPRPRLASFSNSLNESLPETVQVLYPSLSLMLAIINFISLCFLFHQQSFTFRPSVKNILIFSEVFLSMRDGTVRIILHG